MLYYHLGSTPGVHDFRQGPLFLLHLDSVRFRQTNFLLTTHELSVFSMKFSFFFPAETCDSAPKIIAHMFCKLSLTDPI